jgi:hypothetical protein
MATSVAAPLERQFGRIAGLTEMTSTSYLGSTSVSLQFDLSRSIDGAARDVQAAINAARGYLPPALPNNPSYRKVDPADAPIMIVALTSDTLNRGQMYDAASSILQQKLSQQSGVGQVIVGGQLAAGRACGDEPHRAQSLRHPARDRPERAGRNHPEPPQGPAGRREARLADRGQRSAPPGRRVRPGDRHLPVGTTGAARRRGADRGLGGGRAHDGARKRAARGAPGHLPAAGRQHHLHGGRGARASPGAPRRHPAGHHHVGGGGSNPDDPGFTARRRGDARDLRAAGDARGVGVSAKHSRDTRRRRGGAGVAGGHLRRDVRLRREPGQPVPHGPDDRDGLRGGRRHRRPRERGPASGGRSVAARGGAPRSSRDRLHGARHQPLASRGLYTDPVDGRPRWPPVP